MPWLQRRKTAAATNWSQQADMRDRRFMSFMCASDSRITEKSLGSISKKECTRLDIGAVQYRLGTVHSFSDGPDRTKTLDPCSAILGCMCFCNRSRVRDQ